MYAMPFHFTGFRSCPGLHRSLLLDRMKCLQREKAALDSRLTQADTERMQKENEAETVVRRRREGVGVVCHVCMCATG